MFRKDLVNSKYSIQEAAKKTSFLFMTSQIINIVCIMFVAIGKLSVNITMSATQPFFLVAYGFSCSGFYTSNYLSLSMQAKSALKGMSGNPKTTALLLLLLKVMKCKAIFDAFFFVIITSVSASSSSFAVTGYCFMIGNLWRVWTLFVSVFTLGGMKRAVDQTFDGVKCEVGDPIHTLSTSMKGIVKDSRVALAIHLPITLSFVFVRELRFKYDYYLVPATFLMQVFFRANNKLFAGVGAPKKEKIKSSTSKVGAMKSTEVVRSTTISDEDSLRVKPTKTVS